MLGSGYSGVFLETAWRLATLTGSYDENRLPAVLGGLEPRTPRYAHAWIEIERVRRLTYLAAYHLPLASHFGPCLKLALVRYAMLRRRGLPVIFHLGLRPQAGHLAGHAWLSLHDTPLWETGETAGFRETFRYPSVDG